MVCTSQDKPNIVHCMYRVTEALARDLRCTHHPTCAWTGPRSELPAHLGHEHASVACGLDGCPEHVEWCVLALHEAGCGHRIVTCRHCSVGMQALALGAHQDTRCPKVQVECPRGCGATMARGEATAHENDCCLLPVPCPFELHGCRARLVRKNYAAHQAECAEEHAALVAKQHLPERLARRQVAALLPPVQHPSSALHYTLHPPTGPCRRQSATPSTSAMGRSTTTNLASRWAVRRRHVARLLGGTLLERTNRARSKAQLHKVSDTQRQARADRLSTVLDVTKSELSAEVVAARNDATEALSAELIATRSALAAQRRKVQALEMRNTELVDELQEQQAAAPRATMFEWKISKGALQLPADGAEPHRLHSEKFPVVADGGVHTMSLYVSCTARGVDFFLFTNTAGIDVGGTAISISR